MRTVAPPGCAISAARIGRSQATLSSAVGWLGSYAAIARRGEEVVDELLRAQNRPAAQHDEIMLVARLTGLGLAGARAMEITIGGALQQAVQRAERTRGRGARPACVDLLKAQNIGGEPVELRPQDGVALVGRDCGVFLVRQIFQIEACDSQYRSSWATSLLSSIFCGRGATQNRRQGHFIGRRRGTAAFALHDITVLRQTF